MAMVKATGRRSRRGLYTPKPTGALQPYSRGKKKNIPRKKNKVKNKIGQDKRKSYRAVFPATKITSDLVGHVCAVPIGKTSTHILIKEYMVGRILADFIPPSSFQKKPAANQPSTKKMRPRRKKIKTKSSKKTLTKSNRKDSPPRRKVIKKLKIKKVSTQDTKNKKKIKTKSAKHKRVAPESGKTFTGKASGRTYKKPR